MTTGGSRWSLPEPTDHLSITKDREPARPRVSPATRRYEVHSSTEVPLPQKLYQNLLKYLVLTSIYRNNGDRETNYVNDRFSDSQPVRKSFHCTTPYLSEPQNQIKAAILTPIFKKHLSLSIKAFRNALNFKSASHFLELLNLAILSIKGHFPELCQKDCMQS